LVEEVNKATEEQIKEVNYDGRMQLFQAVRLSELLGLGLKPATLEKINSNIEARGANAFKEGIKKFNIDKILSEDLGYTDAKSRLVIENEVLDFYIPEK
jgi:hypothetical protein